MGLPRAAVRRWARPATRCERPGRGAPTSTINGNIYLSGNVMLDDGTPPPDPVTIERICEGAPKAQAYTDQKGRFSFQIGQTAGVTQDASEDSSALPGTASGAALSSAPGGLAQPQMPIGPDMMLANCDLRAVLSGFRSDTVSLGARRSWTIRMWAPSCCTGWRMWRGRRLA